jgi:hypothetical protein
MPGRRASRPRTEARAARERIVTDAEALADSVQWKVAGERLRELLHEWKTAPHVDRTTEQALWKRFGAARNSFDRRRRQHFAQLSAQQSVVKAAKQKLIAEAEELATSTDWGPTAARLRSLMDEWKAAGRVGRSRRNALWTALPRRPGQLLRRADSVVQHERDARCRGTLRPRRPCWPRPRPCSRPPTWPPPRRHCGASRSAGRPPATVPRAISSASRAGCAGCPRRSARPRTPAGSGRTPRAGAGAGRGRPAAAASSPSWRPTWPRRATRGDAKAAETVLEESIEASGPGWPVPRTSSRSSRELAADQVGRDEVTR